MIFSIDSEFTRCFDDAVSVSATPDFIQVNLYIADISDAFTIDSDTHAKASELGETRTERQHRVSMLPESICDQQYSLLEGKKRRVIKLTINLDFNFEVLKSSISQTEITKDKGLSFKDVNNILSEPNSNILYKDVYLACMIARGLMLKRSEHSKNAYCNSTAGIYSNEDGYLVMAPNELSGQLINQEINLLANSIFSEKLAATGQPAIFRNQVAHPTRDRHSYSDFTRNIQFTSNTSEAIKRFNKTRRLYTKETNYSTVIKGHFGLKLSAFGHFTSPLRRFVDLVNQRILVAQLKGEDSPYTNQYLDNVCLTVNKRTEEELARKSKDRANSLFENSVGKLRNNEKLESYELRSLVTRSYLLDSKNINLLESVLCNQMLDGTIKFKLLADYIRLQQTSDDSHLSYVLFHYLVNKPKGTHTLLNLLIQNGLITFVEISADGNIINIKINDDEWLIHNRSDLKIKPKTFGQICVIMHLLTGSKEIIKYLEQIVPPKENYLQILNNRLRSQKVEVKTVEYGPVHNRIFFSALSSPLIETRYHMGLSRKESRQKAANEAISQLSA